MVPQLDKQNILTVGNMEFLLLWHILIFQEINVFETQDLGLFKTCWRIAVIFGAFTQQDSSPSLILAFLGQGFKDNI